MAATRRMVRESTQGKDMRQKARRVVSHTATVKDARKSTGEKTSVINGAELTGHHTQNVKIGLLSFTMHRNKLKVDQRP